MLRNPVVTSEKWTPELVLIDFGLASISSSEEDAAVDLFVLERAFVSTHPGSEQLVEEMYLGYQNGVEDAKATLKAGVVLKRLEAVRARGRKRECFG